MRISRFLSPNLFPVLLLPAMLANSAIAGTPGRCSDTSCPSYCGTPGAGGSACSITVSESRGVANVSSESVCVVSGTKILWSTGEKKSKFRVDFTDNPFVNTSASGAAVFKGKEGHAKGDTAVLPPTLPPGVGTACYQYSAKHKLKGQPWSAADPKVIVTSVRFHP